MKEKVTQGNLPIPWLQHLTNDEALVMDFRIKHMYGNRTLTSFGENIQTDDGANTCANILMLFYGTKWDRLYKSYVADYNPIWNVDGTETTTVTNDLKRTTTGNTSTTDSGSDLTEDTSNVKNESSRKLDNSGSSTNSESDGKDSSVYGFDSAGASPERSERTTTSANGSSESHETESGSNEQDGTSSSKVTYGKTSSGTNNGSESNTGTITTEVKRGGNIGVTMTQQLLEADINYWNKPVARFYDIVIKDILNEITLKIYVPED